jgi:hypothetical protein
VLAPGYAGHRGRESVILALLRRAYWKHAKLTNASQEGFNNKIGWLTRQAYGYRDEEYLHLKICDLPNLSTRKDL